MLKRIIKVLMVLVMAVSLAACGDGGKAQKEVATKFLDACVAGNFDEAAKYVTDDANKVLGVKDLDSSMQKEFKNALLTGGLTFDDMGEKFKKGSTDLVSYILSKLVDSYTLDSKVKNNVVVAHVKIIDTKKMSMSKDVTTKIQNIATEYTKKNLDKLQPIYAKQGYKGLYKTIYEAVGQEIFDLMKTEWVDKLVTTDMDWALTVDKNNDGELVITKASMTKDTSTTKDSSGE